MNGQAVSAATSTLTTGNHSIVAVYNGATGFVASTSVSLTQVVQPQVSNDAFANRRLITGTSVTVTGSTVGATKEAGEPNHAGNRGGKSVWFVCPIHSRNCASFAFTGWQQLPSGMYRTL